MKPAPERPAPPIKDPLLDAAEKLLVKDQEIIMLREENRNLRELVVNLSRIVMRAGSR